MSQKTPQTFNLRGKTNEHINEIYPISLQEASGVEICTQTETPSLDFLISETYLILLSCILNDYETYDLKTLTLNL